ncbi:hypothetical protein FOZ62_028044, partial [Perkinsus olseni]
MKFSPLLYLLSPVCVSSGRTRGPIQYVQPEHLPAGTYKAVAPNEGGVCPELPNLVDFEMVVWDGPRGQMATFGFLERQEALAGHRPFSSDPLELVWYHNVSARSLRGFGALRVDRQPNCFHGSSLVRVGVFMGAFYSFLKLTEFQGRLGKGGHLIICQTELGLVVGLGPRKREIPHSVNLGTTERELYHYSFQLARQISANEGTAGVLERAKERISHPVSKDGLQTPFDRAVETPLDASVLGGGFPGSREEEVWSSVDDAAIPSFGLPTTAQPAPVGFNTTAQQGVDWIDSAVEAQGAYYLRPHAELWPGYYGGPLEFPEDSSTASIIPFGGEYDHSGLYSSPLHAELWPGHYGGPLPPPEHSSISTIIPSSGEYDRSGVVEGWAVLPDGQYETTNVDVAPLERVTVEIRSELQTGQRRVQLTAKFKGFEMQFSEETAVFFGDCLHLDFSAKFHDSDMFIFKDSLKFNYVYP